MAKSKIEKCPFCKTGNLEYIYGSGKYENVGADIPSRLTWKSKCTSCGVVIRKKS